MENDSEPEHESKPEPVVTTTTLLRECGCSRTSKHVWKLEDSGHVIAFIGTGESLDDYTVRVSGFGDKEMNMIWKRIREKPDPFRNFVAWLRLNAHSAETPGFSVEAEVGGEPFKMNVTTEPTERPLVIYTWGHAIRAHKPDKSQRDWFVGIIHTRAPGVDLRRENGRNEVLQAGIASDPQFPAIMNSILEEVEKNNYTCISISCTKGRHRSVAVAELVKKWFYPNAMIEHLTIS